MKKGYLFISNGFKPSQQEAESIEPIAPSSFSRAAIYTANKMGWELHMGVNRNHPEKIEGIGYDIKFYNQHTYRSIFALRDNWRAYKNLCKYIKENPQIEIIHCNTPIGGVIGRLAGRKFKKKVIYTAHGFHFYKGAPLINRTLFKWIEQYLAHYTDCLITINKEDFQAAQHFKLKKDGKVWYVPGVGIDLKGFEELVDRSPIRRRLGISEEAVICISIGDLNNNKNTITQIKAIQKIENDNIYLLICGIGPNHDTLLDYINSHKLGNKIKLLGFRKDIKDLLGASDIFIMSSKREGLPRSTMEAMAVGLPCIVSKIRGNADLIENHKGGYLIDPLNIQGFAQAIEEISKNKTLQVEMGKFNKSRVDSFAIHKVHKELESIFSTLN